MIDKKNIYRNHKIPSGDICVEAVKCNSNVVKKKIIKKIKGWDENIYTYHEDVDLCLRLRKKKISNYQKRPNQLFIILVLDRTQKKIETK